MTDMVFTNAEIHQIRCLQEYGLRDAEIAEIFDCQNVREFKEVLIQTEAVNVTLNKTNKAAVALDKANDNARIATQRISNF